MEIMHQSIAHLAFARFARMIADTHPGTGVNTRTVAAGGGLDPGYEAQNKKPGDNQSSRYF
jgi:hypothetical protein